MKPTEREKEAYSLGLKQKSNSLQENTDKIAYVYTETTCKFEWETDVWIGRAVVLRREVHENWQELVICYTM